MKRDDVGPLIERMEAFLAARPNSRLLLAAVSSNEGGATYSINMQSEACTSEHMLTFARAVIGELLTAYSAIGDWASAARLEQALMLLNGGTASLAQQEAAGHA